MQIFSLMGDIILNDGGVNAQLAKVDESASTTAASLSGIGTSGELAGAKAAEGMDAAVVGTDKATASAKTASAGYSEAGGSILKSLGPLALMFGAFAGGEAIVKAGKDETDQYSAAHAQLANQLKTSKDAIGLNMAQLEALAEASSKNNDISKASNLTAISTLLNYNAIGKDALPTATKAVDDLATKIAMSKGQSVPSLAQISQAAKMVGKAMEDPTTGINAFSRAMITFSPTQQAAIKALQKHGDTAGAAALMMKDLTSLTSGAASSAAQTYQGKVAMLTKTFDEWSGAIVNGAEKALTNLGMMVVNVTSFFEKHKVALDALIVVMGILGAIIVMQTGFWIAHTAAIVAKNIATLASTIATNAMTIAHGIATAAVGVATAAQWLFNAAMAAGLLPILAVIAAVALVAFGVYELIKNWSTVSAFFVGLWKDVEGAFSATWNWIVAMFLKYTPEGMIISHWSQISKFFVDLWAGVKSSFSDAINFMISGLNLFIKGFLLPFNVIIKGLDLVPGVHIPELSLAIPSIPHFNVGTKYLPSDMLIQAHKGEMIVPKSENPYANSGGKTMPQNTGDMVFNFDMGGGVVKTVRLTSEQIAAQQRQRTGFKAVVA